jgi:hypothetical protein
VIRFSRKPVPHMTPQRQSSVGSQTPKTNVAPLVHRRHAQPKVLQTKQTATIGLSQSRTSTIQPAPSLVKKIDNQSHRIIAATRPAVRPKVVQPFASRVVQAVKFYPNLHPGAVEPVAPGSIFRLNSFADQYRLHKVNSHGVNVPNQQYNFVRTREGEMLLHGRYRHPSIAQGKQVLYAGEIFFNNGQLEWWSNGSGHYQPNVDDAEQANLPMDQFFSYQQIIKGEHKRKKGR